MSGQNLVAVNQFQAGECWRDYIFGTSGRHVGNDAHALVSVSLKNSSPAPEQSGECRVGLHFHDGPPQGAVSRIPRRRNPYHAGECRWDYITPERPVRFRPIPLGASR